MVLGALKLSMRLELSSNRTLLLCCYLYGCVCCCCVCCWAGDWLISVFISIDFNTKIYFSLLFTPLYYLPCTIIIES